jgi:hypothetical protein
MINHAEVSEFYDRHSIGCVKNLHNVFSFFVVIKITLHCMKGITVMKVLY